MVTCCGGDVSLHAPALIELSELADSSPRGASDGHSDVSDGSRYAIPTKATDTSTEQPGASIAEAPAPHLNAAAEGGGVCSTADVAQRRPR